MGRKEIGMDRRAALTALGALSLGAAASSAGQPEGRGGRMVLGLSPQELGWDASKNRYFLPPLPYDAAALEPHIDSTTMQIHHDKHHQGYVDGLNEALDKLAAIRSGEGDAAGVRYWTNQLEFNGGGHVNHSLFWLTMAPPEQGGGGRPTGELLAAIERDFGSFEAFADQFKSAAASVQGSGWGWLVYEPIAGRLMVLSMEKQQNNLLTGVRPLLGVDVWEHAYYLKYQNRRAEYLDAFMKVVNWSRVSEIFEAARGA